MSKNLSNAQVEAIDELINAFGCSHITSRQDCAESLFCQDNASHEEVGREMIKFATKMKTRDPRFASFFMRTVGVLQASHSMRNVEALVDVFIKCRKGHVFYATSSRERAETKSVVVKSPFFNRRSASRGKLPRIDRLSEQTSSSDFQLDLLHRNFHHDGVAAQTPPSTSARNPLFSGETSGSCYRANIAPNTGTSRVVNGYPSVYKQPLHSRKGTTPSVPEDTLCRELCGALQGLEGSYFRKDSSGYMRVLESCSLSESQRSVVESVLLVAHLHTDIVRVPREYSNDLIVQAFLLSSQEILQEYIHDIGDMPSYCRPLCFLQILSTVERWRDRLTILQRLYNLRNETGTSLFELLYTVYNSVVENFVVDKVLECCAGVLCRLIVRWMSGFEVKECDFLQWIPPFFPVWVAEYILKTGKSWKSVDVKKCTDNLDKAREIIAKQLNPKSLYVQGERCKLERIVREVCLLVCGSVVHSFVSDHQLIAHLDVARSFLLLHDSQFSHVLYQQFCEHTHGLRSKLSQRDANNALMVAVTLSSSVRRFHFKINLDTLSSANDSPNTSSRLQFVHPLRPVYRPNGPIGEIFRDTEKRQNARSTSKFTKEPIFVLRLVSSLLSVCERTLLKIRIYITVVVDQWFNRLRCWIDDAVDLDAVINAHTNYLRGMTSSFFMDSDMEDIYGFIMSLLQISHDLTRHCVEISMDLEAAQRDVQNTSHLTDLLSARTTQLLVIKAKVQVSFHTLFIFAVDDFMMLLIITLL
ncbi:hypothetical protein Angca_000787 [Angiostrongylus cantonensis]|nr:hypothetical protein Angca_000787 [Angiostrongylus cantonensis]